MISVQSHNKRSGPRYMRRGDTTVTYIREWRDYEIELPLLQRPIRFTRPHGGFLIDAEAVKRIAPRGRLDFRMAAALVVLAAVLLVRYIKGR